MIQGRTMMPPIKSRMALLSGWISQITVRVLSISLSIIAPDFSYAASPSIKLACNDFSLRSGRVEVLVPNNIPTGPGYSITRESLLLKKKTNYHLNLSHGGFFFSVRWFWRLQPAIPDPGMLIKGPKLGRTNWIILIWALEWTLQTTLFSSFFLLLGQ